MHKSVFSFTKLVCLICGLLFFSGIFTSCDKNSNVEVMYISRFMAMASPDAPFLLYTDGEKEAELNRVWVFTTTKGHTNDEDEGIIAEFDSHMSDAEALVRSYQEKYETPDGRSAEVSGMYILMKNVTIGRKSNSSVMKMYEFKAN